MSQKPQIERDPIRATKRRAIAQRRIGEGATCEKCSENRPLALVRTGKSVLCAECIRKKKGHKTMDKHHPAGKTNHPATVEIPVNDHRAVLSQAQHDWPKETLENPDRSPLLRAAACIRGFINMVHYMIDKFLAWIPEMLETLNQYLIDAFQSIMWWLGTPLEKFAGAD